MGVGDATGAFTGSQRDKAHTQTQIHAQRASAQTVINTQTKVDSAGSDHRSPRGKCSTNSQAAEMSGGVGGGRRGDRRSPTTSRRVWRRTAAKQAVLGPFYSTRSRRNAGEDAKELICVCKREERPRGATPGVERSWCRGWVGAV